MGKHHEQNEKGTPAYSAEDTTTPEKVEMFPRQKHEPSMQIIDLICGGMHKAFEY